MKLYQDAEKFINDIYWQETYDKDNSLDIQAAVHSRLIEDNIEKDPDYYNHREGVVHVTSLSKCLRGLIHEMIGTPQDAPYDGRKLGVFKAGNLFEDFIIDALGKKMLDRQTEYVFKYKNIILTGRDDGTALHENNRMVVEAKSVHSDSFWHREREGTLVAWNNQIQLQTYLWLRRECPNVFKIIRDSIPAREILDSNKLPVTLTTDEIIYTNLSADELSEFKGCLVVEVEKPDNSNLNGIFSYISKDDCTISSAPIKFNQNIIDNVIIPSLEIVNEGYEKKDPTVAPNPELIVYSSSRTQYQKNWLCTYCEYHNKCAGAGWVLEASNLVERRNKELKEKVFTHTIKKEKPTIEVIATV